MKTFLEYVAEHLIKKYGSDLAHLTIVFPNKRAALFLNQAIAKVAEGFVWAPTYVTISELFRSQSDLTVADPIKSMCVLYQVYKEVTKRDETLDQFYGWGQILLADFDDLDKNLVDAHKLFGLLSAHKELDDTSYISPDQWEIIKKVFRDLSPDRDSLRRRYLEFWDHLEEIYTLFRARMRGKGLAYEGMLYRDVIEKNPESLTFPQDKYAFVGFNLLQEVEQKLFQFLKEADKAVFYWDYDNYYLNANNEAGRYISKWLQKFPNELKEDSNLFLDESKDDASALYDCLSEPKGEINFISSPTENLQARYVSKWLLENDRYKDGKRTAIVMCDEHLLQTVIHCIPTEVDTLNVTTGYPLQQTLIASMITQLIKLQFEGYSEKEHGFRLRYLNRVLRHPYAKYLLSDSEKLLKEVNDKRMFFFKWEDLSFKLLSEDEELLSYRPHDDSNMLQFVEWLTRVTRQIGINGRPVMFGGKKDEYQHSNDALFQESVFRMYTLLIKLKELMKEDEKGYRYLDANFIIFRRLLGQLINSTTVPFHGEPAQGVQIMGVLETRNLDFDHVLLLSCNEGNMPKGVDDASFILHSIRKENGMTTIDNKVAIFSYYFHRLIQRANDVTILYNNSTQGSQTGEMSRFMLQFMVEWPHRDQIQRKVLIAGQEQKMVVEPAIKKDEKVMKKLDGINTFSPSAINVYRTCQAKYYYSYIVGLKEEQDNDDDNIDNRMFGTIFHEAAELLYRQLGKRELSSHDIDEILKDEQNKLLNDVTEKAIAQELFGVDIRQSSHKFSLNGLQLLNKKVIVKYLRQLLRADKLVAPIEVIDHEFKVEDDIEFSVTDSRTNKAKVYKKRIGGRIDRLDRINYKLGDNTFERRLRIVDYKTGYKDAAKITSLEDVFDNAKLHDHADYVMQAMLYSILMADNKTVPSKEGDPCNYNPSKQPVCPALLFIQRASGDDYSPIIQLDKEDVVIKSQVGPNDTDYKTYFREHLQEILSEIYNSEKDFERNGDEKSCVWCPFKSMCGK